MSWLTRTSRGAVRLMQSLVPHEPGGVTILTYHLVNGGTQSPVDLPLDAFRTQLRELREFAHVCSLPDAVTFLNEGIEHARPVVVVTVDDGYDNFRTEAWPLFKEFDLPCTFYVPVGFVEGRSTAPLRGADRLGPIAWNELRRLASDPLLTVGSHSWGHQDLRRLSVDELRADLTRSRALLQDRTGVPVEHFCYPRAKWSRDTEREVGQAYRTAVVAGGRRNFSPRFHPLRLWRVPIRRDMPAQLAPVLRSAVWLEEWAASHARALT